MFCPECGKENRETATFCKACGGSFGEGAAPDSAEETEQPTLILPASALGAENAPPVNAQQKQATGKKKLLLAVSSLVVAAAFGGGAYFFAFAKDEAATPSPKPEPVAKTSEDKDDDDDDKNSKTSTRQKTTRTNPSTSTTANNEQAFVDALDPLIARNAALEQQIVTTAAEINRVAPKGITPALISSAADLTSQFEDVKSEAGKLAPPQSFISSRNDFIKLIDLNISRSTALEEGASAWRNSQPIYEQMFLEGQQAKNEYLALYPQFESEYKAAKAGI